MIVDGEKWACESCVRGHRVSNCQHSDRPLQHINKKGRPVSQCPHCRSMRRTKSAHVKCDCGEKTSKCPHLQPTVEGHRDSCCCNHGGRCTCSHKKEQPQLDTVPESDSENESTSSSNAKASRSVRNRRSRASTQTSDGMLTFDENGHHKPTYKHQKASQKSGPYQFSRVNSTQSAGSAGDRSMENLANVSTTTSNGSMPQAQDQRLTKSETASPLMTGTTSIAQSNSQLPRLDLSAINGWAQGSYVPDNFELFGSVDDHEQPIFSAGLSAASVDWSHYDLEFNSKDMSNFAPSSYSQPQSFGGFEQPPTLTSGEASEVEDFIPPPGHDFDPIDTFSRTNTSSTGCSLAPSQEILMSAMDLTGTAFEDYNKLPKDDGNKYYQAAASLAGEDLAITAAISASGMSGFVDDDPIFWMGDQDCSDLPAVNDVPDANAPNFWEVQ